MNKTFNSDFFYYTYFFFNISRFPGWEHNILKILGMSSWAPAEQTSMKKCLVIWVLKAAFLAHVSGKSWQL